MSVRENGEITAGDPEENNTEKGEFVYYRKDNNTVTIYTVNLIVTAVIVIFLTVTSLSVSIILTGTYVQHLLLQPEICHCK